MTATITETQPVAARLYRRDGTRRDPSAQLPDIRSGRQRRADKATRRSVWAFLVPMAGVPIVAFYFFVQDDVVRAAGAAVATAGLALLLGPLILWWAVSGLRRGSRHLLVGLAMGFAGACLTTGLLAVALGSAIGWSLVTGSPIPGLPADFDLTRWLFLSPENPLNPGPLRDTAEGLLR